MAVILSTLNRYGNIVRLKANWYYYLSPHFQQPLKLIGCKIRRFGSSIFSSYCNQGYECSFPYYPFVALIICGSPLYVFMASVWTAS